jgi:hypothetical protein
MHYSSFFLGPVTTLGRKPTSRSRCRRQDPKEAPPSSRSKHVKTLLLQWLEQTKKTTLNFFRTQKRREKLLCLLPRRPTVFHCSVHQSVSRFHILCLEKVSALFCAGSPQFRHQGEEVLATMMFLRTAASLTNFLRNSIQLTCCNDVPWR